MDSRSGPTKPLGSLPYLQDSLWSPSWRCTARVLRRWATLGINKFEMLRIWLNDSGRKDKTDIRWYQYHITSLPSVIIRSSGIPNSEVAFHSCISNLSKSLMGRNPQRLLLARIHKTNRSMDATFAVISRFQSWLLNIFFDSLKACLHVKPGPSNGSMQVCSSYLSYLWETLTCKDLEAGRDIYLFPSLK